MRIVLIGFILAILSACGSGKKTDEQAFLEDLDSTKVEGPAISERHPDAKSPGRPDLPCLWNVASTKIRINPGQKLRQATDLVEFPQFFPQVWKTLGRDQRHIALSLEDRVSMEAKRGCRL